VAFVRVVCIARGWREKQTFIFPNLLAIEEARSMEAAAMMLVVKNRDPSLPSSRPNFSLKNQVTQELYNVSWWSNLGLNTMNLQRSKARGKGVQGK
jgi:hypothetical protein